MPLPDWFWEEDDDVVLIPFEFRSAILDAIRTHDGRRKLAASMTADVRHKAKTSNFGMLYGGEPIRFIDARPTGEPIRHFVPRTTTGRTHSTPEIQILKERKYVPGKVTGTISIDYAKIEMDEIKRLIDMDIITPEKAKELLADAPV